MGLKKLIAIIPLVLLLFSLSNNDRIVYANDISTQDIFTNSVEAVEVSKEQIISEYVKTNDISYAEASNLLFPPKTNRNTLFRNFQNDDEKISYVMFRSAAQYTTRTQNIPGNAGQVYFYREVSTSGWFRGIKRIIYAGYNSGNYVFNGSFQYHLADPNIIHYTLNGGLYSNTTTTVSTGGGVGLGEAASVNISVSSTSNYVRNLYYHGSIGY